MCASQSLEAKKKQIDRRRPCPIPRFDVSVTQKDRITAATALLYQCVEIDMQDASMNDGRLRGWTYA